MEKARPVLAIFGDIISNIMAEIGTFYKKGTKSDYIGVEVLGPSGVLPRVIIEEIKFHESLKIQGKTEHERWTCKFKGISKPMLLNSTCRKRLAKRFWNVVVADGEPCAGRIDLLSGMGLAVRLDSEPCRDPNDGDMTVGLRISKLDPAPEEKAAPAAAPKKKEVTEDKIEVVVEWARKNGKTIADIEQMYDMSQPVRDAIADQLEDLPE